MVAAGIGKLGDVRMAKGRPLQATTNSLSPLIPLLDIVTTEEFLAAIFFQILGQGLVWLVIGLYTGNLWGGRTRLLRAAMKILGLEIPETKIVLLISVKAGCHPVVLVAS